MPIAYSEAQLVEQPAIGLFAALVYLTATQIQNLCLTHDLLLPRLLSGRVKLSQTRQ